ncbi:unnamed protein product [Rhizophagus irregularis]|nr:unnamed protein product [Rhizophagus irregularis]
MSEILDKELTYETLENKGSCLRNHSMSHKEYTTRPLDVTEFPLSSAILEECFLAENVDKSYRITAQDMWDLLTLKAQEGEIESSDVPKVTTIQGWIIHYAVQLREKSAQKVYEEAN